MRKLVALALVGTLLTGCGLSSGSTVPVAVGPGSIKPVLSGVHLAVGSKDFTENIVLGLHREVFTTDARILSLNLQVLDDDQHFFPQYNAALTVRSIVLAEHPQIEQVLKPVSAKLDNETTQKLNAQVDVQGKDPADVARDWLVHEGFVTSKDVPDSNA